MARKVTARDRTVRTRWASFLSALVGDGRPIAATALAKAINANRGRQGDATWQIWEWLEAERTVSPPLAFDAGEALRACGIGWSTGLGALWAAGYLGEYALRLANFAQDDPSFRDLAVLLGMQAPLFASPSLARDLHADAEWLDKDRRAFAAFFAPRLPVAPRGFVVRCNDRSALADDELLTHAAALGDDQNIEIAIRERMVWTLVVEWGINAASATLREGRLADVASLLVARPRRLIETAREAAVARARDLGAVRHSRKGSSK